MDVLDEFNDTACYDAESILQSEFPEVFLAGISCIIFNFIFFAGWSLSYVFKLFKILWIYRPFSRANNSKMGTRNMNIGEAKESVLAIFSRIKISKKYPDVTYSIAFFFLLVRALIGPVIEFVHAFVDTKYYLQLINCEDIPISRKIHIDTAALFCILIFIVLGIMFLPISAAISLRRHQEALGCKRVKTFELVKADVTLCLSAIRVLGVLAVVDLPKTLLMYFYVEKYITSPNDQGRSPAGYLTKNVSFLLIWVIALCIVFARARLNREFFMCPRWYGTFTRICLFIIIPATWFCNQLFRMIGVVYQSYFFQEDSISQCAKECFIPDLNHPGLNDCCLPLSECNIQNNNGYQINGSYYKQEPFTVKCLNAIDYLVLISAAVILIIFLFFGIMVATISANYGGKLARLYINGIIDMGYPKGMNLLHVAAYYGDVHNVKYLIKAKKYNPNLIMEDKNTALHLAASNGFAEICYSLVKEFNADISIKNADKYTAERVAEVEGFELIRRYLQQQNQKRRTIRNYQNQHSPIFEATADEIRKLKTEQRETPRMRPTSLKFNLALPQKDFPSLDTFAGDFNDCQSIADSESSKETPC